MDYQGSCHCGAIQFEFTGPAIDKGLRCNRSICIRNGALMTAYTIAREALATGNGVRDEWHLLSRP